MYEKDGTLKPAPGLGRWAVSRKGIHFVENTPVFREDDPLIALVLLGLPLTKATLEEYFPCDEGGKRRPTFTLMRLWHQLGETNNTWSNLV